MSWRDERTAEARRRLAHTLTIEQLERWYRVTAWAARTESASGR